LEIRPTKTAKRVKKETTETLNSNEPDSSGDSLLSYSESEGTQQLENDKEVTKSKSLIEINFLTVVDDAKLFVSQEKNDCDKL
jgi:hypothetical protein